MNIPKLSFTKIINFITKSTARSKDVESTETKTSKLGSQKLCKEDSPEKQWDRWGTRMTYDAFYMDVIAGGCLNQKVYLEKLNKVSTFKWIVVIDEMIGQLNVEESEKEKISRRFYEIFQKEVV